MGRRIGILLLLAVSVFPSELLAGTIWGRLLTAKVTTKRNAPPPSEEELAETVQPGAPDAVIYVDRIPDKVEEKLTRTHWWQKKPRLPRIIQEGLRFQPRVLVAPGGTRVEFENMDRVIHNAFSVSVARRFDLGRYRPGQVDTVAFDRVGVANLHCDIHPQEIGFVVVVPNHAFTRPDSLGYFELPKLPAGNYVLRVWHPRLGDLHRDVTMPRRGDVELEVKL